MSDPDLARRQAEVVAALTGTGPVPDGFDRRHLETARRALLRKRARELHHVWPVLTASLGSRLERSFEEFARDRPTRGVRADGHAFAQWLRRRDELPLAGAMELAEARLHWRFPPESAPPASMPTRLTSHLAIERFPGGIYVRRGHRVTTLGRPTGR